MFQGAHKAVPKGTKISVKTDGPTTVYAFFEHVENEATGSQQKSGCGF